ADQTLRAALDARSREHLINVLERTDWQKQKAAEILDVDRATLYRLLKKLRIEDRS
ncbi:MAG: transcriptional regulator of acetoin/glycerol metabolism, partial [Kiritimatiellia bacterium]